MPKPILAQFDPRHEALARRVSAVIADVLDGEILAPWEVVLVLSVATLDLHVKLAQAVEQEAARHA